jgi:hypothetical protein
MQTTLLFLTLFSLFCLVLCFVRSWDFTVLLAIIELGWVGLITLYGVSGLYFLDLTFFFWASMLFIFSAVEVILGFLAFLLFNKHRGSLDAIKCGFLRVFAWCAPLVFFGGPPFVFTEPLLRASAVLLGIVPPGVDLCDVTLMVAWLVGTCGG